MHTKGEWRVVRTFSKLYIHSGPRKIADLKQTGTIDEETEANAEHICLCVNSHDELLAACENALIGLESWYNNYTQDPIDHDASGASITKLKAAIAGAKEVN